MSEAHFQRFYERYARIYVFFFSPTVDCPLKSLRVFGAEMLDLLKLADLRIYNSRVIRLMDKRK
jgi:hypothetical protein